MKHPKRPTVPRQPLYLDEETDIVWHEAALWRIHRTVGQHVLGWDQLRRWGPAKNCRWDPHPEPAGDDSGESVMYVSLSFATAVVEAFQESRRIDPHTGRPKGTSWKPTRPLRLLDATGDWSLRNGASAALTSAPRSTCRAWARVIRETWPDLDGIWVPSTLTGQANVTLWQPAADTFPASPAFSEYLADDLLWDQADRIAARYSKAGYRLV